MTKILILLSTYNGEKYLAEQLDSVFKQQDVEFTLLIRDDGSTDRTIDIIEEYCANYSNIIFLKEGNIGCAKSFYRLMDYASTNLPNYDYCAFCDQDDVWEKEKLSKAALALNKSDHPYKLYFSGATYVDGNLKPLYVSNIPSDYLQLRNIIFKNRALGCTMVFNYGLLNKTIKIKEFIDSNDYKYLPLHDAWTNTVAVAFDSYIYVDNTPSILYRRHGGNVTWYSKRNSLEIILGFYKRRGFYYNKAYLIYKIYQEELPQHNSKIIKEIVDYKKTALNTLSYCFKSKFYSVSFKLKLLLKLTILLRIY